MSQINYNSLVNEILYERDNHIDIINCNIVQKAESNSNIINVNKIVSNKQSFLIKITIISNFSRLAKNNATELLKYIKKNQDLNIKSALSN